MWCSLAVARAVDRSSSQGVKFSLERCDFEGNQRPRNASGVWCGCLVGVRWVVGLSETPEPHEHKETRGVVLLLFENLKGDFEGLGTAKCQFGGLG